MNDSRTQRHIPAHRVIGELVPTFINRLRSQTRHEREIAIKRFVRKASQYGCALVEGSTVYLFYAGRAKQVNVPGDLNEWSPSADVMFRVRGTNFHYLAKNVPGCARFEYRLAVDSTWILDPYNHQLAIGGSVPNSEVAMPGYRPPDDLRYRAAIPHGAVEAMDFPSTLLKRSHPVFMYLPHGYRRAGRAYPSLYVLDGGDYLSLGMMATVLDNLIAAQRIRPIVAVFVDPRTDVTRPRTNKRAIDYTMSDPFVAFLTRELRPAIERTYHVHTSARNRGLMGTSLGGLLATYAAYKRPDVFSLCAAQSPAYWWKKNTLINLIADGPAKPVRFYLDTGTIHDTHETTRAMRDVLEGKGYRYSYAEYPEGHNWGNWRARIPKILEYFWGIP